MSHFGHILSKPAPWAASTSSVVPQTQPIPGRENDMKQNKAGGFTFIVDFITLVLRILILGTTKNSYYSTNRELTADALADLYKGVQAGRGHDILDQVEDVYMNNRAPKLDNVLMVLARMCCVDIPVDVRRRAYGLVAKIRTFSQLYGWKGCHKRLNMTVQNVANEEVRKASISNAQKSGKTFAEKTTGGKGFGRAMRTVLQNLIALMPARQLAYQAVKYPSRKFGNETWSIYDMIRCAHIKQSEFTLDKQIVMVYIMKDLETAVKHLETATSSGTHSADALKAAMDNLEYLSAVDAVKKDTTPVADVVDFVTKYNLPREALNTVHLKDASVWRALLCGSQQGSSLLTTSGSTGSSTGESLKVTMPITALVRNLGVMTSRGLFDTVDVVTAVANHLTNVDVLKRGRVHPILLLNALLTYKRGSGLKGSLTWTVKPAITDALEKGFYLAFGVVPPTGARVFHAFDVSGSMTSATCAGCEQLTSNQACAVLAMVSIRAEDPATQRFFMFAGAGEGNSSRYSYSYGYGSSSKATAVTDKLTAEANTFGRDIKLSPTDSLETACRTLQASNFFTTDCSLPMLRAIYDFQHAKSDADRKKHVYDAFIVYTDSETYAGRCHPSVALKAYNDMTRHLRDGKNAKFIVVATVANSATIADPSDPDSLEIIGFDINGPMLISNFITGAKDSCEDGAEEETSDE